MQETFSMKNKEEGFMDNRMDFEKKQNNNGETTERMEATSTVSKSLRREQINDRYSSSTIVDA